MDENQIQELQSTSWFNKYNHLHKKALQFLVSLSLLSFLLLSCSSSPSSHFFHYLKLHYSALLFPILSQALDRKYIFLICNGIVAVLVKSLSFTTDSKPSPDFTEDVVKAEAETEALVDDKESAIGCDMKHSSVRGGESSPPRIGTEVGEEEDEEEEEEEEGEHLIPPPSLEDEAADEEAEAEESGPLIPPPSAEDAANEVNVSTEELNRKIEEFIRKMKEELRIEAKTEQLVPCSAHT